MEAARSRAVPLSVAIFLPESSAEHLTSSNSLERVADVFDLGRVVIFWPDDGHDVEPASLLEQAVFFQEMEGCKGQPALFFRGDGFCGHSLSAGLDLNEDDNVAVECDQIDLALIGPVAAMQDPQTLAAEVASGFLLAAVTEQAVPERLNDRISHRVTSQAACLVRYSQPREAWPRTEPAIIIVPRDHS